MFKRTLETWLLVFWEGSWLPNLFLWQLQNTENERSKVLLGAVFSSGVVCILYDAIAMETGTRSAGTMVAHCRHFTFSSLPSEQCGFF